MPCLAYLAAYGVRYFASAGLLLHPADRVRNLLCAGLRYHSAGGVRNSASDAFFRPGAGRVGHLAGACLLLHVADRVRNLLLAGLGHEVASRVRNLGHTLNRYLTADRVGHFLVADFRDHSSAGNGFVNHLWNPFAAAHRTTGALDSDLADHAWITWVGHTLLNDWPRDAASFRNPFTTTFLNGAALGHWLADRVADVFVAGLSFSLPGGRADVFVAGLVDWLADVVADCSVTGLVDRLTDCVALVAVAGLVNRLADSACHIPIAGLVDRLADRVTAGLVAGLVDRCADGVAFVTETGFVDVFHAGDRHGLGAVVVNRLGAGVLLLLPDHFLLHVAALRFGATASGYEVATGRACGCQPARKTALPEQSGHRRSAVKQQNNCCNYSQHEPVH
jgi:hypothetical protein